MEFSEVVSRRRSVRSYLKEAVPASVIERAIDAALLAPNSSNMQTWRFYWVQSADKKLRLAEACMNQSAARTASELVVIVADPSTWKTTQQFILKSFGTNAPEQINQYYRRLMPLMYGFRLLAPLKWLAFNTVGLFRPMPREPWSSGQIELTCVKSAALAAENFMLAVADQGYDSCPMEGFDSARVRRLLDLPRRAAIVMVIAVGRRDPSVDLFKVFRLPRTTTVQIV